jgi:thiol-disulfide isomerase/thioredoxin
MKSIRLIIISFAFLAMHSIQGQAIKIYDDFADFEPLLQKSNDTVYVVNFWATWCKPCVKELPEFQEINKKFMGEKFRMILVSLDFESQVDSKVKPFIKERDIKAEVVVLADSKQHQWIDKVDPDWSGSIPITLVYNKDFRFFKEGTVTFEELNELITKNLIQ